jgi:hypothetical protein
MPLFRRGNTLGLQTDPPTEPQDAPMPFVTPDQLTSANSTLRNELSGLIKTAMAEVRGAFQGMQQPQARQEPQLPQIDDVSDADYQQALQVGDAQVIQRRENANRERLARAAAAEVNRARAEVTPIIESMSGELATTILGSLPYYTLFKKDVDSLLGTIPPAQRNRQVIEHIYHAVCGRPENIARIREYANTQAQQRETERAMASDTGVRRGQQREKEESFEQVFGEQFSSPTATLQGSGPIWQGRRRGYDPDSYARDIGFKDKQEYTRFSKAVMTIEDCPLCLSPVIGGKCASYCKGNKMRTS